MEYFLIELKADGKPGIYIVYRGENLADMSQIPRLNMQISQAITSLVRTTPHLSTDGADVIKDAELTGYGARFYVDSTAYHIASRMFLATVRTEVEAVRQLQAEQAPV